MLGQPRKQTLNLTPYLGRLRTWKEFTKDLFTITSYVRI